MTAKNNINALSDGALVELLGRYIKGNRLGQNKTQQALATEAGINRSTLAQFENGKKANLVTFIQLLRALKKLDVLEQFQMQVPLSPIQLTEMEQAQRKRASRAPKAKKIRKRKSGW